MNAERTCKNLHRQQSEHRIEPGHWVCEEAIPPTVPPCHLEQSSTAKLQ